MKKKGKLWLTAIVVVLAAILYLFAFGLSFGIKEFKPIHQQFKARKMQMDFNGGSYAVYVPKDDKQEVTDEQINRTIDVIRSRLEFLGYTDCLVAKQGENKINLTMSATGSAASSLLDFLIKPSKVQVKDPDGNVIITDNDIASARYELLNNDYVVAFTLTKEGKQKYAEATANLINSKIKIYINDEVVQEKTIKEAVNNGEDYISSNYSPAAAIEVAAQLNSGTVSYELKVDQASIVTAVNGYISFRQITIAGFLAAALVIVALIALYRIPGLMVSISFLYYIAISAFCVLTIPSVRLNMSGFVGFLIATAVFVDTNIIILNRIKQEIMMGKTFESAFQQGFSKTFNQILYSNLAIVVLAFGLMFTAGGNIVDFAYVLGICVAVSYLVTYAFSRALIKQVVKIGINNAVLYLGIKGDQK